MWAGEDLNLRRLTPTGLQPVPFGRSGTDPWTGHNCTGQGQLCDLVPAGSESAESTAMP